METRCSLIICRKSLRWTYKYLFYLGLPNNPESSIYFQSYSDHLYFSWHFFKSRNQKDIVSNVVCFIMLLFITFSATLKLCPNMATCWPNFVKTMINNEYWWKRSGIQAVSVTASNFFIIFLVNRKLEMPWMFFLPWKHFCKKKRSELLVSSSCASSEG